MRKVKTLVRCADCRFCEPIEVKKGDPLVNRCPYRTSHNWVTNGLMLCDYYKGRWS